MTLMPDFSNHLVSLNPAPSTIHCKCPAHISKWTKSLWYMFCFFIICFTLMCVTMKEKIGFYVLSKFEILHIHITIFFFIFVCFCSINKHEGEWIMTLFSFLGELPFEKQRPCTLHVPLEFGSEQWVLMRQWCHTSVCQRCMCVCVCVCVCVCMCVCVCVSWQWVGWMSRHWCGAQWAAT